jgi:hypothetical protein
LYAEPAAGCPEKCAARKFHETFALSRHFLSGGLGRKLHEYDVALKHILMRDGSTLLAALTGSSSLRWLNVEAPLVRNLRVDLLGETPNGDLVQIEFQSRNERHFPLRMAEYLFSIGALHGRLPRQIVLYVGDEPMRMKDRIEGPDYSVRFHLVDARDLDGERLLASDQLGDNVVAVLTRLGKEPDTVRRILKLIAGGSSALRDEALAEFLILAGLRKLRAEVEREAKKMPIHYDILDNPYIGPLIKQRIREGSVQAWEQGRLQGQVNMLLRQLEKRFGRIPSRFRKRVTALNLAQLEQAGLRLLDARRIEDVFVPDGAAH